MNSLSGKFVLRLDPALHEALHEKAANTGLSLNETCVRFLEAGLQQKAAPKPWLAPVRKRLQILHRTFGKKMLGAAVFGSQVEGTATPSSDVDLLIVLDSSVPVRRSLYRQWEKSNLQPDSFLINPHFVHFPDSAKEASGLWFEVALEHETIYQQKGCLEAFFAKLLSQIRAGKIRRDWSHGHPYWVWSWNEK